MIFSSWNINRLSWSPADFPDKDWNRQRLEVILKKAFDPHVESEQIIKQIYEIEGLTILLALSLS
jgi:hypothetical protein